MLHGYAYSAYGETVPLGPDGGNPLQYTGRENDGTGLYYYRARYYDPLLKRFIAEDPIGLDSGDANFYSYVSGNPVMSLDPSGLAMGGWNQGGYRRNTASRQNQVPCDDDCPDPVTINFTSTACRAGDVLCGQAMQAAGIPGPYYPQTKTYSKKCLLTLGLGVKATSTAGSTIVMNKAPGVAAQLGASASTVGVLEGAAAVANNPLTIGIAGLVAADQVMKQCECKTVR